LDAPEKIPLLVVTGPTACGKTAQAVRLCEFLGGEVVSADSMQIYSGMEIATAKPSAEEMRGVPHHLLGVVPPSEPFSVAKYKLLADAAIAGIYARGKLPVLVGGTGLYIRAVTENLTLAENTGDPAQRNALAAQYDTEGGAAILRKLAAEDPAAAKIHPNDKKRVIRAMELHSAGCSMTSQNENSRRAGTQYHCRCLLLGMDDRALLYARIHRRVDAMLAAGLLEEARTFFLHNPGQTAAQAIGYKELAPHLRGECTLQTAADRLKTETRRYAKRQLTWFRIQCPHGEQIPAQADGWTLDEARMHALQKWRKNGCD
jgi:tRNA dimethylallyltransferase